MSAKRSAAGRAIGQWIKRVILGGGGVLMLGVAVVGLGWWMGAFADKIEPGVTPMAMGRLDAIPDVTIDEVHEVHKDYIEEAVGTFRAADRTEISAQVLAKIVTIHVAAADRVEKGDVLIELDQQAVEKRIGQAQAALEATIAVFDGVEFNHQQLIQLRESLASAVTDSRFNHSVSELQAAKAKRSQAEQALAEAEVMRSRATIHATRRGIIAQRRAEEGDMARPGVPLLSMYDPDSMRLEVPVTESLAVNLNKGDRLTLAVDALNRRIEGTVDEKLPQAEAASRSVLVKVKPSSPDDLIEGMFGRLELRAGQRRHLCLNVSAIQTIGQLDFVRVVRPDGETWERRYIQVGRFGTPERIEVLSGLEAGERVIVPAG